jgi:hypothetical protein
MKIAFTIPGLNGTPIDSGLPSGIPTGGFNLMGKNIVFALIDVGMVIAILFCLYLLIIGGISMSMSRGNKEKMKSGWEKIFVAIVGLVIIFMSYFAISILGKFAGIDLWPMPFK